MRVARSELGSGWGAWPLAVLALACAPRAWGSQSIAPLLACRSIADAAARLACFDRESATLAAGAAAAPAPAQSPASAGAPAVASQPAAAPSSAAPTSAPATAAQNFGLSAAAIAAQEVQAGKRPAEPTHLQAHLMELSRAGDGRLVFTLDNGQIWLQVLEEGDLLLKPGDAVTLSRGLFHSFTLRTNSGRFCKVTRIR
jgi:hypothetical protein